MKSRTIFFVLLVYFYKVNINALNLPGPRVYVVTPSTRLLRNDENKITPFYYHKWLKRMDTAENITTTMAPTSTVKTPDLIFAEFESEGNMQKSIRKLLEKERITKLTTMSPIYVPEFEDNKVTRIVNYGLPINLNNLDNESKVQIPVFKPSSTMPPLMQVTRETTTTMTENNPINLENIWHIIDDEKKNQYSGTWQEVQDKSKDENVRYENRNKENAEQLQVNENADQNDKEMIDENFALPGFATNPVSGAENESRAIRTEPNIRFPYVNLKPFQIKSSKKPSQSNNLLTSLDQFSDLKYPTRGEVQDINPKSQPVDRYNPAQPYLPQQKYGKNLSKQSSVSFMPQKATANLVPPPPPPPPKADDDFPSPPSYDSFPPYAPSGPSFSQVPAPPPSLAPSDSISSQVLALSSDSITSDSSDDDEKPIMDLGYRYKPPSDAGNTANIPMTDMGYQYKPPSPPMPQFFPTVQPTVKPFESYSYNKPSMTADLSPPIEADSHPEVQGYHYQKPPKPSNPQVDHMPQSYNSQGVYGSNDLTHSDHNSDYPELIFSKPHDDMKGDDHMKDHDIGMMPPSPSSDTKPDMYGPSANDLGFPIDFPTDLKFHHDFGDHDHDHDHHYHYHHPTTTTTETPRVNRFSYYYLGKKLYYLPLYFSVYFIVYVGALIIKAVLRHKIVYPNSWRPNTTTATFFSKRSVDEFMSNDNLHELTKKVTHAIATAAEKYMAGKTKTK